MMFMKSLAFSTLIGASLVAGAPTAANATHEIGHAIIGGAIGTIIGNAIVPRQQQPVYVQPAPVYVQPAPVYVQPAPVYVQPAPVYVEPRPVYVQPGYSAHQSWCLQRYRSYNPSTDVYFVKPGVPRYCQSPYN